MKVINYHGYTKSLLRYRLEFGVNKKNEIKSASLETYLAFSRRPTNNLCGRFWSVYRDVF